jgi:acetylxylan esterase
LTGFIIVVPKFRLLGFLKPAALLTLTGYLTVLVNMKAFTVFPLLAGLAQSTPFNLQSRQGGGCPKVHVFGARETTVSPGFGTSAGLVQQVVGAYPGTTSEAIQYPACGGQVRRLELFLSQFLANNSLQSSCGGASYDSSASQGTAAVVKAVTAFNKRCPETKIVLVGYSQVRI